MMGEEEMAVQNHPQQGEGLNPSQSREGGWKGEMSCPSQGDHQLSCLSKVEALLIDIIIIISINKYTNLK